MRKLSITITAIAAVVLGFVATAAPASAQPRFHFSFGSQGHGGSGFGDPHGGNYPSFRHSFSGGHNYGFGQGYSSFGHGYSPFGGGHGYGFEQGYSGYGHDYFPFRHGYAGYNNGWYGYYRPPVYHSYNPSYSVYYRPLRHHAHQPRVVFLRTYNRPRHHIRLVHARYSHHQRLH